MASNENEICSVLQERSKECQKLGFTVLPFIMGIGEPIRNYAVIVGSCIYMFSEFREALDICFKAYVALQLRFSAECRQVWHFISEFFYELELEDCLFSVKKVIKELNRFSAQEEND